jgi:TPP-dependent 2-oxoacid decarboxylase
LRLVSKINLPTAIAPAEKGSLDESIPQFIGLYHGDFSSPASVKQVIESADLVLDIGGIIRAELNAGLFTDDFARLNYHLLPEAFGCQGWLTAKVGTVAELDEILSKIEEHDGAAYIQVLIPEAESQPLPSEVIDRDYKIHVPPVG